MKIGVNVIFSPSLWLTPNIPFDIIHFYNPLNTKIYLYAGGKESETMIPNVNKFREALEKKGLKGGNVDFELSVDANGQHSEYYWGREFPKAVKWLFFEKSHSDEEE